MLSVSEILSEYFDDKRVTSSNRPVPSVLREASLPVAPAACNWEIHTSPERFSKKFAFSNKLSLLDFIREVLVYETHAGHDGLHKIDGLEVTIEVYTHDINRITELDQEYITQVDNIHRDVLDFG